MEFKKLKSIRMSMMKVDTSDIHRDKPTYTVNRTARFELPVDFFTDITESDKEELIKGLIHGMYEDLIVNISFNKVDSIGLWIDYDGKMYEAAMQLVDLKRMEDYGVSDLDSLYEFFKMTLVDIYSPIAGDVKI